MTPSTPRPRTALDEEIDAAGAAGAGATTALVAAMGASVLRAAAHATDDGAGIAAQAEALQARLTSLAEANADAYERARRGLAGDLSGDGQEERDRALRELLHEAASVPASIADAAADVAVLGELLALHGAPHTRPDAEAVAVLAAGSARASAVLVGVNLTEGDDGPLARRARAAAARAQGCADRAVRSDP